MDLIRARKTLIASAAFAVLLAAGTAAGCASGSLALQPPTSATPASADQPANPGPSAALPSLPSSSAPGHASTTPAPRIARAEAPLDPANPTPVHGITVTGTGQVQARPDEAIVTVGVQTRAPIAQDAQASNNRTMQAVIDAIKGLGIPDKDIQTTGVALYPNVQNGGTVSGYTATNNVTIVVEKIDQAGAVLDAAVRAGANTTGNVRFTFKDETSLRNKALAAAALDARSKAEAIATALGLKITDIQSISESSVVIPRPFAGPGVAAAPAAAPAVPIEPGQQTITATVTAVFGF